MYIFVFFCLHVTKSKQISKIIVATCSQGQFGFTSMQIPKMILKKIHKYIFVVFCLHVKKSKKITKIIVATCSHGL